MKNLLLFGFLFVINNINAQETSNFNFTQNYKKVITYEVEGLSESDLIVANALFFNSRLNNEQKNLINNPYAYRKEAVEAVENAGFHHPLNQYNQEISNIYGCGGFFRLKNQKPVLFVENTIDVSTSQALWEKDAGGDGRTVDFRTQTIDKNIKYASDEMFYDLKINIEDEKISLSIVEGRYARTIQMTPDKTIERRKTFDEMFNKKGEIKKLLKSDAEQIVKNINNSILNYFNFIECFKNKKIKIDSKYSIMFNEQLKMDSLEQRRLELEQRRLELEQRRLELEERRRDSINSLFTGIVVAENFYDGDHKIEIIPITRRGKDTLYRPIRFKEFYYLQSGENDEYSILKKNGLNNNGENITGTYVKGRWAEGKVLVEDYQDDGSVLTSTRVVPRIIEIEPVVDENTDKFNKFSGYWSGKFTETKYTKNKIHGEWNAIVSNNGIVLGEAISYYVTIRKGLEYNHTKTDQISGVLSANGEINMKTSSGAIFTGRFSSSSVTGKWVNGENLGGSFTGKEEDL